MEQNQMNQKEKICNWCGESCYVEDSFQYGANCGLIDQSVTGNYYSTPGNGGGALDDMDQYAFSLCEFCLDHLFQQFKIPPSVKDMDRSIDFVSAKDRVLRDDWRKQKDKFFAEFERRNKLREK